MRTVLSSITLALFATTTAHAAIVEYKDDKAGWFTAVGSADEIAFNPPSGTTSTFLITQDYYSEFGITLASTLVPGGCNWALDPSQLSGDGWIGSTDTGFATDTAAFIFDDLQTSFALEKFGIPSAAIMIEFFEGDQLVGAAFTQLSGGGGVGVHFWGWRTDFAFDRIHLSADSMDGIFITNIPTPSGLAVICMVAFRRRRRPGFCATGR